MFWDYLFQTRKKEKTQHQPESFSAKDADEADNSREKIAKNSAHEASDERHSFTQKVPSLQELEEMRSKLELSLGHPASFEQLCRQYPAADVQSIQNLITVLMKRSLSSQLSRKDITSNDVRRECEKWGISSVTFFKSLLDWGYERNHERKLRNPEVLPAKTAKHRYLTAETYRKVRYQIPYYEQWRYVPWLNEDGSQAGRRLLRYPYYQQIIETLDYVSAVEMIITPEMFKDVLNEWKAPASCIDRLADYVVYLNEANRDELLKEPAEKTKVKKSNPKAVRQNLPAGRKEEKNQAEVDAVPAAKQTESAKNVISKRNNKMSETNMQKTRMIEASKEIASFSEYNSRLLDFYASDYVIVMHPKDHARVHIYHVRRAADIKITAVYGDTADADYWDSARPFIMEVDIHAKAKKGLTVFQCSSVEIKESFEIAAIVI